MMDALSIGLIGVTTLGGLGLTAMAALRGWKEYIDLKRLELAAGTGDAALPPAGGRIEIADLKERVRKLEAIANGIDL